VRRFGQTVDFGLAVSWSKRLTYRFRIKKFSLQI